MLGSRSVQTVNCEISDDALQGPAEKEKLQTSTPDLDLARSNREQDPKVTHASERGPPLFQQSVHSHQARLGIVSSSGVSALRVLSLASAVIGLRAGRGWRMEEGGESGFLGTCRRTSSSKEHARLCSCQCQCSQGRHHQAGTNNFPNSTSLLFFSLHRQQEILSSGPSLSFRLLSPCSSYLLSSLLPILSSLPWRSSVGTSVDSALHNTAKHSTTTQAHSPSLGSARL